MLKKEENERTETMEQVLSIIRNEFIKNAIDTKLSSSDSIRHTSNNVPKVGSITLPKQAKQNQPLHSFPYKKMTHKRTELSHFKVINRWERKNNVVQLPYNKSKKHNKKHEQYHKV